VTVRGEKQQQQQQPRSHPNCTGQQSLN